MANYLLVESRDAFESGDVPYFCNLAKDLSAAGNNVTVFLVQNGVLMARKGIADSPLQPLLRRGKVQVLADEFCLKERAVQPSAVLAGVKVSNVDALADLLAQDGVKAVWH